MSESITTTAAQTPPSWVEKFVARAKGTIERAEPKTAVSYVRETASTAGDYSVDGLVGGLLGATHGRFGLDTKGGPIDGWAACVGGILAIGLSAHFPTAAAYARKIGSSSFGILMFRKSYGAVKHAPLPGGTATPGVTRVAAPTAAVAGEDPIEKVARGL